MKGEKSVKSVKILFSIRTSVARQAVIERATRGEKILPSFIIYKNPTLNYNLFTLSLSLSLSDSEPKVSTGDSRVKTPLKV